MAYVVADGPGGYGGVAGCGALLGCSSARVNSLRFSLKQGILSLHDFDRAHSSSGQGHRPLKAETTGSNPVCATAKKPR
jgi:hypothetical protein